MLPSLILIGLFMLSLGISIANHGKPRSNENAITTLIVIATWLVLLYWGGFFNALITAIQGGG